MRLALIAALILLAIFQIAGTADGIVKSWRDYRAAAAVGALKDVTKDLLLGAQAAARERRLIRLAVSRSGPAGEPDMAEIRRHAAEADARIGAVLARMEQMEGQNGRWPRVAERLRGRWAEVQSTRLEILPLLSLSRDARPPAAVDQWQQASDGYGSLQLDVLRLLNQPTRLTGAGRPPAEVAITSALRLWHEMARHMLDVAALAASGETPSAADRTALERADARVGLLWSDLAESAVAVGHPPVIEAVKVARALYDERFAVERARLSAEAAGSVPVEALDAAMTAVLSAGSDVIAVGVIQAGAAAAEWRRAALLELGRSILLLLGSVLAVAMAAVIVRQGVLRPIDGLTRAMRRLAAGDTDIEVPAETARGEVGEMARAVGVFKRNAVQQEIDFRARERAENLLRAERGILEMVAGRAPLDRILDAVCAAMEERLDGALCSVLLLSPDGRCLAPGAAPSLSPAYVRQLDGIAVGPVVGSCGTAIWRREPVIVGDIATDPLWADYRALALQFRLAACWSLPILAPDGAPLGAFAAYYRSPRAPEPWELEYATRASNLAAIAIGAHRAAEQLQQAKAEAELGSRTKSEFLANMSHELRTPLNAIIGFAEVLEGELRQMGSPLAESGYVDDIIASGRHLLTLINDILDVSKMEAGKIELRERVCDVAELLTGCERIVRARAMERRVELQLAVPVGMPPILVDDVKFKQIVLNLLSNAVKFTGPGGTVTVSVTADKTQGIRVLVKDTGIGIKPEDLGRIFVPFHQVDNIYARISPGTGLGLALSKGLAELHGGSLHLESEFGVGTTAVFRLPAYRLAGAAQQPARSAGLGR